MIMWCEAALSAVFSSEQPKELSECISLKAALSGLANYAKQESAMTPLNTRCFLNISSRVSVSNGGRLVVRNVIN